MLKKRRFSVIGVGIGGWIYEPWRDNFYPKGLPQAKELAFASKALTSIEINSTYYGSQKPASFTKWASETPDDFVFSVKGPRFTTNRKVLAESGESIARFFDSGVTKLGAKLGPVVWQFAPTKKFDPDDFGAFLSLLPAEADGLALRHALEVRHESFVSEGFVKLARKHGAGIVLADSEDYPLIADVSGGFAYMRLQRSQAKEKTGYPAKEIKAWTERALAMSRGEAPPGLPLLAKPTAKKKHDVFVYVISGAKERAPHGAQAIIAELSKAG
ncbi:MAG: DUF72 domain-containing protein [Caulobacterales bacterium]